ncbi:hypothetical protein ECG_04129 [Echinococcus granulosus]|uniref:Transposase n=1 Tax=Echinococcus granulosus TaxID=6210 RepID=A0A068WGK2_ECHGR|nr:hypothetical protein ECG_04129 [Echinococcus granulosus]CDS17596.1 hypothetical protein EgrG_001035300 [Echinococcus granulosus]
MIVLGLDFKTTPAKPRAIHNVRIFPALPKMKEETSGGQPYRQSLQKQLIKTGYRSITESTCRKEHVSEGGEE